MAEILVNNQIPIVSHKYKINVQFSLGPLIIWATKILEILKHSYFSAATYDHLFGPPTPAAVRRMKNKKFYGDDIPSVRKSKKPLPGLLLVDQSAQGDPGHLLMQYCPGLVWSGLVNMWQISI